MTRKPDCARMETTILEQRARIAALEISLRAIRIRAKRELDRHESGTGALPFTALALIEAGVDAALAGPPK